MSKYDLQDLNKIWRKDTADSKVEIKGCMRLDPRHRFVRRETENSCMEIHELEEGESHQEASGKRRPVEGTGYQGGSQGIWPERETGLASGRAEKSTLAPPLPP